MLQNTHFFNSIPTCGVGVEGATPPARRKYVLTLFNNMYVHICYTTYQYVCTYRKIVVPLQ